MFFFGSDGYLELNGSNWKAFRKREKEPFASSKDTVKQDGTEHWANFLDAIRSGKDENLTRRYQGRVSFIRTSLVFQYLVSGKT